MRATVRTARNRSDNQLVTSALEVFRLMSARLDGDGEIDCAELQTVVGFLKNSARCETVSGILAEVLEAKTPESYMIEVARLHIREHGYILFDTKRFELSSTPDPEFSRFLHRLEARYIDPHCI